MKDDFYPFPKPSQGGPEQTHLRLKSLIVEIDNSWKNKNKEIAMN